MIRIAIDLELESDGKKTGDIIQLGYCIFETTTGKVLYLGGDYVKVGRPLHPFIIRLTKITDRDLEERGVSLHEAYFNMVEKYKTILEIDHLKNDNKESTIVSRPQQNGFPQIVEWTSGDVKQLKMELHEKSLENYVCQELKPFQKLVYFIPFSDSQVSESKTSEVRIKNHYENIFGQVSMDIKATFQMHQMANQRNHRGGLKNALHSLGLEFEPYKEEVAPGKFRQRGPHNAIADSLNTARIYLELQKPMIDNQFKKELPKYKQAYEILKNAIDWNEFDDGRDKELRKAEDVLK